MSHRITAAALRKRAAVRPAAEGTFSLPTLGASYTVGRDHVGDAVRTLINRPGFVAVDIETEGLGVAAMNIKAVTIASDTHAVILDPRDPRQADIVFDAMREARALVLHNSPFDVPIMIRNGLMSIEDVGKVIDTMIYARLAEPGEHTRKTLTACAARYLGTSNEDMLAKAFKAVGMSKAEGFKAFDLDRPLYVHGAAIDGIVTARIAPLVRQAGYRRLTTGHPFTSHGVVGAEAERLLDREQVINRVFLRRAAKGMRVDLEFLDRFRAEVGAQRTIDMAELDVQNIRSGRSTDLTKWLDDRGLLPASYPRTAKTKAPSGLAKNLDTLKHPVAQAFLRVKQADKIEKDYLQKVVDQADEDDRIHPTTLMFGATTGRMSMSEPPLHQFIGRARGIILADEGDTFTSIDWSQIEPVVAANIAKDLGVLRGYEAGTSDLYTDLAAKAGIGRKTAKVVLLAQMYGEGMAKLAADLDITEEAAWQVRRAVFSAMPKVEQLIQNLRQIGRDHQLILTMSGRIVPVPMSTWDGQPSVAAHKAVNYFVQGSAYDVLAEALVKIDEAGLGDAVYIAMHDELVVSSSAAADVRKIMETPPERLIKMSGRTPVLRTDLAFLGTRWDVA